MSIKIAFLLLAHEPPEMLRPLLSALCNSGNDVFIHYDSKQQVSLQEAVHTWGLDTAAGSIFFAERLRVEWGEWSIVEGTLRCLKMAVASPAGYTHYFLLSGSCMPIKPIQLLEAYLKNSDFDFIEAVDAEKTRWIVDGIQQERWEQYHFLNWAKTPVLFSQSLRFQKRIGIRRTLPAGLKPSIGSQWWCLRASTVSRLLSFLQEHPETEQFYCRTWVPDESFFQTLVRHLVAENERSDKLLLSYAFNRKGSPRIFCNDHLPELLLKKDFLFFARKISPYAVALKNELSRIAVMDREAFAHFLKQHAGTLKSALAQQIGERQDYEQHRWKQLAHKCSSSECVIARLPVSVVVVCAEDKQVRIDAAELIAPDKALHFHDLFNRDAVEFGKKIDIYAGYAAGDASRVHYSWPFFLKDVMAVSKTDVLVFTLGDEAAEYLEALKWAENVTVVLIESNQMNSAFNHKINAVMSQRKCVYHSVLEEQSAAIAKRINNDLP